MASDWILQTIRRKEYKPEYTSIQCQTYLAPVLGWKPFWNATGRSVRPGWSNTPPAPPLMPHHKEVKFIPGKTCWKKSAVGALGLVGTEARVVGGQQRRWGRRRLRAHFMPDTIWHSLAPPVILLTSQNPGRFRRSFPPFHRWEKQGSRAHVTCPRWCGSEV